MFVPIPILIAALIIFALVFLGAVRNGRKGTNSYDMQIGTMTVSQAYKITSRYGNAFHELCEAQSKAVNTGHKELLKQIRLATYLSDTISQIQAALMLTVAQGVLNAKGEKDQFNTQPESKVVFINSISWSFSNDSNDPQPTIPSNFADTCCSIYAEVFSSCTANDFANYSMRVSLAVGQYWEKIYERIPLAYTPASDDFHKMALRNLKYP